MKRLILILYIAILTTISMQLAIATPQNYQLTITTSNTGNTNNSIEIQLANPWNGNTITNPAPFQFNINYLNQTTPTFNCELTITNNTHTYGPYPFDTNGIENTTKLGEGQHQWTATCQDTANNLNGSTQGTFNVQDEFNIQLNRGFTMQGNEITLNASANAGTTSIWLQKNGGAQIFITNITGTYPQTITIPGTQLTQPGTYSVIAISHYFSEPAVITKQLVVGGANVTYNSPISTGTNTNFNIDITADRAGIYSLKVGTEEIGVGSFSTNHQQAFQKTFSNTGSKDVKLRVTIENKEYNLDFGDITIINTQDTKDPEVELIYPDWEETIQTDEITFRYRVTDNAKINNCSLELFNATKSSNNVYSKDELIYPLQTADKQRALNKTMKNNSIVSLPLIEFDQGHYIWDVECYDNSSNKGSDFNYFYVDLNENNTNNVGGTTNNGANYSRSEEVATLIDKIDEFLEKEEKYAVKEKEVIEIMGLGKDMAFYKKQLVQIDQDFKFNLKFQTEEKRAERIREMNEKIDEIKEQIIIDIEVGSDYEYSKNSLDTPLSQIIEEYLEASGTQMKKSDRNALIKANEEIQTHLKTQVSSKKVTLRYLDREKDIVLVRKKFQLSKDTIQTLIEVLPKEIRDNVIFLAGGRKIGEGIYEFDLGDLEEGEMVYYFEEDFDLKTIEQTESVLFSEEAKQKRSIITGMVGGISDSLNGFSFFIIFLVGCIGYVGFFIVSKAKIEAWKKYPNVTMALDLIAQTKHLIRINELEKARKNYHELQEIYKVLPLKCKNFFYKEIKRILTGINKKDILNLVKEYELAKTEFRKEDAITLHKRIGELYKKLPKRYQEKIYQRIVKKEV